MLSHATGDVRMMVLNGKALHSAVYRALNRITCRTEIRMQIVEEQPGRKTKKLLVMTNRHLEIAVRLPIIQIADVMTEDSFIGAPECESILEMSAERDHRDGTMRSEEH